MDKIFYVIIRTETDDVTSTAAVTPLLCCEEEAFKRIPKILEEDLDGVDYDDSMPWDTLVEGVIFELGQSGWSSLDDIGLPIVYTLAEIEIEEPCLIGQILLGEDVD